VFTARRLRVCEAKQVTVRPAIALLILHRLVRQFISFTTDIPATHGISQATTPTTQSIHILREVEQVRPDTADLAEVLKRQRLGFGVAVSCHQRQSKNGRIVLRRAAAIADFNDAVHGANTIRLDAANNRVVVLLHEIAFGDVIRAAFSAEDEETVEARPIIDLPRIASA